MKVVWSILAVLTVGYCLAFDNIVEKNQFVALSLKKPESAVMFKDKLYVVDSKASSLFIFDSSDKPPVTVGTEGRGAENFSEPKAVAVAENGNIFVADTGNSRIQVLSPEGKFLFSFGHSGSSHGQLSEPEDIAFGPDGRLYVADTGNNRIQIFNQDGIFCGMMPVESPVRVAVSASESVFVQNRAKLISVFSPEGVKKNDIKVEGERFCLDPYDFIYTIDFKKGKVREYPLEGKMTGEFGSKGKGQGQFYAPSNIMSDKDGNLYIVDPGNKRILQFQIENKAKTRKPAAVSQNRVYISDTGKSIPVKTASFGVFADGRIAAFLGEKDGLAMVDAAGKTQSQLAGYGNKKGQVKKPLGMAVDKDGKLYVTDASAGRIAVFSKDGKYDFAIGEKMKGAAKEAILSEPSSVDIADNGNLLVADPDNQTVSRYSPNGMFISSVGPEIGTVKLAMPVAAVWGADGSVYVLDSKQKKIFHIDNSGAVINSWGVAGEGLNQLYEPVSMAYDGKRYLYVLDRKPGMVKVFDSSGEWVGTFFSNGQGHGMLSMPERIEYVGGQLYIADASGIRVFKASFTLAPPKAVSARANEEKVALTWESPAEGFVSEYAVYRSSNALASKILVATTSAAEFNDELRQVRTTYYYAITAKSPDGFVSSMSETAKVFVPGNPNAAQIDIEKVEFGNIFSASYKFYIKNPLGSITMTNTTESNLRDVKLSFGIKEYMDFPYDTVIQKIDAGQTITVPLYATLSNRILSISEDTFVQAQFRVSYTEDGRDKSMTLTKPVRLLSRYAIVWDKPARLAVFVTHKDTPIFGFRSAALNMLPHNLADGTNDTLSSLVMIWSALSEYGIGYLSDPTNPYSKVKASQDFPLDTVQMPRDTLKIKSGDCDDLTALIAALCEAAGLHVAIMDYPAHIALMVDTGLTDPMLIGISPDNLVKYKDTYWIPVESTMLGKSFYQSLINAASTYKTSKEGMRIITVSKAWAEYEPATLPETKWEAKIPEQDGVMKRFEGDMKVLAKHRFEYIKGRYDKELKASPDNLSAMNGLGILYAQSGNKEMAKKYFNDMLAKNPQEASALNNLGNMAYDDGKFDEAMQYFDKSVEADKYDPNVWLNKARTAMKMKDKDKATEFAGKAVELEPGLEKAAYNILNAE